VASGGTEGADEAATARGSGARGQWSGADSVHSSGHVKSSWCNGSLVRTWKGGEGGVITRWHGARALLRIWLPAACFGYPYYGYPYYGYPYYGYPYYGYPYYGYPYYGYPYYGYPYYGHPSYGHPY
jgi:hypothetical protein